MLKQAYEEGQKAALAKYAAGFNLAPLLQRAQGMWRGMSPQMQHALIGAGVGGLGNKLVGGDFLPGAALGAGVGAVGGGRIADAMRSMRSPQMDLPLGG